MAERKRKATKDVRSDAEIQTKSLGLSVPLPLHREFRAAAAKQKLSATALLRKLIVTHLDSAVRG